MSSFAGYDTWDQLMAAVNSQVAQDQAQGQGNGSDSPSNYNLTYADGAKGYATYSAPTQGYYADDGTYIPASAGSLQDVVYGDKNSKTDSVLTGTANGGIGVLNSFAPDNAGIVGGFLQNPAVQMAAAFAGGEFLPGGFFGGAGGGAAADTSGLAGLSAGAPELPSTADLATIGNAPGIGEGSLLPTSASGGGLTAVGVGADGTPIYGTVGSTAGAGGAGIGAGQVLGAGAAALTAADLLQPPIPNPTDLLPQLPTDLPMVPPPLPYSPAAPNPSDFLPPDPQSSFPPGLQNLLQNGLGKGLGSLASALAGRLINGNGPGTSGGSQSAYIPTNQAGQDANFNSQYQAYQQALQQYQGMVQPQMMQNYQNQINNPQNAAYLGAAQNAGSMYGNAATQANQNATGIMQAGMGNYQQSLGNANNLFGAGNAAYQAGLDPQQALYNQNVSDLTDNIRAGEYARGIQMSPQGASVEANALGRFQNDWQNQQLGRQIQGADAMSGLYGQGSSIANNGLSGLGRSMGQGTQFQQQGAQFAGLAGSTPYDAQNQIFSQQQQAPANYFSGVQPFLQGSNQLQGNSLNYMGKGQSAQGQAFTQGIDTQNQQSQLGQNLAPLFSGGLNGLGLNGSGNWFSGFGQSSTNPTTPQY